MTMRNLLRLLLAGLLGVAAALLVSCGSSGNGLIPTQNAGPLQSDFNAVAHAALTGDGSCTATEEAMNKTEQDFGALPSTVNAGLRDRLDEGVRNLRTSALALCVQPLSGTSSTSTSTSTTTQSTSTTTQPTTNAKTTPTDTNTTPTPTPPGGGTSAPGAGGEPETGAGAGESGSGGVGNGSGGVGQESAK